MYTQNRRPGRFEGNRSQLLAEVAYKTSLEWFHDCAGSITSWGVFYALLHGRRYSFIVEEDEQGFVSVTVYKSRGHAERVLYDIRHEMPEMRY